MEVPKIKLVVAACAFAAVLAMLVLPLGAGATTPGEIVIPAGYVATISNAAFGDDTVNPGNCPADPLAYGYELDSSANVQLATGVGCEPATGATIGPFTSPTQLRIFLSDLGCGDTFYSDGVHALVTALNSWTWTVSIMDSDLCTSGPSVPRLPVAPGTGNFNLTVTLTPQTPSSLCQTTQNLLVAPAGHGHNGLLSQVLARRLAIRACVAIEEVTASPSARNAALIAHYELLVARLVQGGWLTADDGAYLDAAAAAL